MLDHCSNSVSEEPDVVGDTDEERDDESCMEQSRIGRGLLLQDLYAAFPNPAPNLARDESCEHDEEKGTDFIAENSHREACLRDSEPSLFVELLDFSGTEGAEANPLE